MYQSVNNKETRNELWEVNRKEEVHMNDQLVWMSTFKIVKP